MDLTESESVLDSTNTINLKCSEIYTILYLTLNNNQSKSTCKVKYKYFILCINNIHCHNEINYFITIETYCIDFLHGKLATTNCYLRFIFGVLVTVQKRKDVVSRYRLIGFFSWCTLI